MGLRRRQMRIAHRTNQVTLGGVSPGSDVEWSFADLPDNEVEQFYVTARKGGHELLHRRHQGRISLYQRGNLSNREVIMMPRGCAAN